MTNPRAFLVSVALAASGCTAPQISLVPYRQAPTWQDEGTPPASVVALEREVRYYRDETGVLWDDRGRRVEAAK